MSKLSNLDEKTKQTVKDRFKKRKDLSHKSKENLERVWWRNILYYAGEQWIKWDQTSWRSKKLDPRIPQPVTNKFASSADAIGATLSKIVPLFTYTPTGKDAESKATASICHHLTPILYEETQVEQLRSYLAMISVITGNAFLESAYDAEDDTLGMEEFTAFKCSECKEISDGEMGDVCPHCTAEGTLIPEIKEFPLGKNHTEVLLPFEAFPNPFSRKIPSDWFIKGKIYSNEWIKERFPDHEKTTTETLVTDRSLRYTAELMSMSPQLSAAANRSRYTIDGTALWEMWQEPDKEFPDGMYCAILDNEIVEYIDELPDKTVKGKGYIPITRFGFKPMLGSVWHKSGVDDLARKQKQRNELESLIQLIYMTMGNPVWLKPDGCNVSKITGLPGDQITYSPLASAKPERVDGKAPHPILIKWLEVIDKDFDDLAATFDIMRGDKPSGVRAGYALQVLTERAMARFAPLYREWENAWEIWNRHQLEIFRTNASKKRIEILMSKTSSWETSKFQNATMQGDISIAVEAGTGAPKSQLLERMYIKEILELGLININDPREKMLILEKYGMKHLATVLDTDMKDVLEEEDLFVNTQQPQALRFNDILDNHTVHFAIHRDFVKGDKFKQINDIMKQAMLDHVRKHFEILQQQMMAQQAGGQKPSGAKTSPSGGSPNPRSEVM